MPCHIYRGQSQEFDEEEEDKFDQTYLAASKDRYSKSNKQMQGLKLKTSQQEAYRKRDDRDYTHNSKNQMHQKPDYLYKSKENSEQHQDQVNEDYLYKGIKRKH
jgi:hypothetical protein